MSSRTFALPIAVALCGALALAPLWAHGQPDELPDELPDGLPASAPSRQPSSRPAVEPPSPPPGVLLQTPVAPKLRAQVINRDPGQRRAAVIALGHVRSLAATALLGRVLQDDPSALVRLAAVRALRRHGPPAYPFLRHAAQIDKDAAVSRAARVAAKTLRGRPGYDTLKPVADPRATRRPVSGAKAARLARKRDEEPRFDPKRRRPRKPRSVRFYTGCGVVTMLPVGGWTRHPYAGGLAGEDLDHFGPGAGARVELGFGWPRMMLGLVVEINSLDTAAWENFTEKNGQQVDSHAYAAALYVQGAVQIVSQGPVRFDLHIATGWAQGFGGEAFADLGLEYDYSFFKPTLSFRQGAAFSWLATPHVDLVLGLDHNIAIGGVDYPGDPRPLWSFTLSVGARFWPVERRKR
jgi:HEAT repeats